MSYVFSLSLLSLVTTMYILVSILSPIQLRRILNKTKSLYQALALAGIFYLPGSCLPNKHTDDQINAAVDSGTFKNPSANVRPRFRYWLPDASVDLSRVEKDIEDAAAIGAGGVEVLGYYLYGGNPGDFAPVDWTRYGWGTPAWSNLSLTLFHCIS